MINDKNNLTFFLDKTENRFYSLFFKNHFNRIKEEFKEKGRNLIMIPEKVDENIDIPYQYFLPFIKKNFVGFKNIEKSDFNRYEELLIDHLKVLIENEGLFEEATRLLFFKVYEKKALKMQRIFWKNV